MVQIIFVLGATHVLQERKVFRQKFQTKENEGKSCFRQYLVDLIEKYDIDLIGEEASYLRPTIAQELASARPSCRWVNIDMTQEEKRAACILTTDDLLEGRCTQDEWSEDQTKKEPYMAQRARGEIGQHVHVLIICGAMHLGGIARRLCDLTPSLVTGDVRKESWFDRSLHQ